MMDRRERLVLATALTQPGTDGRQRRRLAQRGWTELKAHSASLQQAELDAADALADDMEREGIAVVLLSDAEYPQRLLDVPPAPAVSLLLGESRLNAPTRYRDVRVARCL